MLALQLTVDEKWEKAYGCRNFQTCHNCVFSSSVLIDLKYLVN